MKIDENEKGETWKKKKKNAIFTHHVRYCVLNRFMNILEKMKWVSATVLI